MNHYSLFNPMSFTPFHLPELLIQSELQKRANPYYGIEESLQKKLRLENERYEIIQNSQIYNSSQLAFNPSPFQALLQFNELVGKLNQYNNHLLQNAIINQQLKDNLKIDSDCYQAKEFSDVVIIIDDDQETAAPLSENPSPLVTATEVSEVELKNKPEIEEKEPTTPFAEIPALCLNKRNQPLKRKNLKQVWNPETIDRKTLEAFFEDLSKILRRKISCEQTAIELLKSFNMNVENALAVIKRNKSQYQNLFNITVRCTRRSN